MADRKLRVGDFVRVFPDESRDPYIFQFQNRGHISAEPSPGNFKIRLSAATGEWGPVPGERLRFLGEGR